MNSSRDTEEADRFLPMNRNDAARRNWTELDVVLFSGDAYVDHPAFGAAVIGRLLESLGLKVALVAQPDWRGDQRDFLRFGRPGLFFAVTGGNMDSLVNHYTAARRKRADDAYTPGGRAGSRPDYAVQVYTRILKTHFPDVPVLLGGVEASLRRLTHYDYWSDRLLPSVLVDSGADMLIYGSGEKPLLELVRLLQRGVPFSSLTTLPQTALLQPVEQPLPQNRHWKTIELHAHERVLEQLPLHAENFHHIERESNSLRAARLVQPVGEQRVLVNPPFPPQTEAEMDATWSLPFTRLPHPRYRKQGEIPAWRMIRNSINLHRGCFGGCSFCTISAHQGKFISSRSEESILREVEQIVQAPGFDGVISDLGGPSANMYRMQGKDLEICRRCSSPSCIWPRVCRNLDTNHEPLLRIYRQVRSHPQVKHVYVGSGIRYDLLLDVQNPQDARVKDEYMRDLVEHHVSGRLKVAPEHTEERVLRLMRKPSYALFRRFKRLFTDLNRRLHKRQQIIPYFISSHPGSRLVDMAELALQTREDGFRLEQVQDFTPTPMTRATVMYTTGIDPDTMQPVDTARSPREKKDQKQFFFWYRPDERRWIDRRLKELGREDLRDRFRRSIPTRKK